VSNKKLTTFIHWIKTSFLEDRENWILWIPVIFGFGIIFYFKNPNSSYLLPTLLLLLSIFLLFKLRNSLPFLLISILSIFILGFLWSKFFTQEISYNQQIDHKFYASISGEIENIKNTSRKNSNVVTLKNLEFYTAEKSKNSKKSDQPRKDRKTSKAKSVSAKQINKNYLNLEGYQKINRTISGFGAKQELPEKISIIVNTKLSGSQIGDLIETKVILEPFTDPYFRASYDAKFNNYFKGIGAKGFAASNFQILEKQNKKVFFQAQLLRKNIANKILNKTDEENGAIAVALIVGDRSFISKENLTIIRNSGLAHLIAISGLHFTLAAGIFFFTIRFLLSLNQHLTLHYNIKKIAAFLAIFAGLFYLIIAGMPVPATRAFIIICLIFLAILLDFKPNTFRSVAFAALVILILSPNLIFSVSFSLSFAAILGLINFAYFMRKYHINSSKRSFPMKFFLYFLGIIFSSIVATIATTPFVIYYFNNFISYGILANLGAIPIVSFITMPFGFLSLILMPFGLERIALAPMEISIGWILQIAEFTTNLPFSYFTVKTISGTSFALIILGGLWLLIWKKNWRFLGLLPIILGGLLAIKTEIPDFFIDEKRPLFAFYYNEKLIFPKPSRSSQARIWAQKIGLEKTSKISDLSTKEIEELKLHCSKVFCEFELNGKRVLILLGRNEIKNICNRKNSEEYDLIINLNKKYQTPDCLIHKKGLYPER
jgi:ComEC/Rec2-related protein